MMPPARCPRCRGWTYQEPQDRGPETVCLSCGWRKPPAELLGERDYYLHGETEPDGRRHGPRHGGQKL